MIPVFRLDSYCRTLATSVQMTARTPDGRSALCFKELLFYPQGGGQPDDRGQVQLRGETFRVQDLTKHKGDILVGLELPLPAHSEIRKGEPATCAIDWERRYRLMRLHTLQHLLAAAMRRLLPDYESRGMVIDAAARDCQMRFAAAEKPDAAVIAGALEIAAAAVEADYSVRTETFPSVEAARLAFGPLFRIDPRLDYRGNVRVVVIEGIDANPCGGTHVRTLKELPEAEILDLAFDPESSEACLRFEFGAETTSAESP